MNEPNAFEKLVEDTLRQHGFVKGKTPDKLYKQVELLLKTFYNNVKRHENGKAKIVLPKEVSRIR